MTAFRPAIALLVTALLAACQSTASAPAPAVVAAAPPAPETAKIRRERRGWVVDLVAASQGTPAHCLADRPDGDAARLSFRAGAGDAAILLRGSARPLQPGERYDVTIRFDKEKPRVKDGVAVTASTLLIPFTLPDYDEAVYPFAHSRKVVFESRRAGGVLGEFPLTGSLWAVNALDECRRLHVRS